MSIRNLVPALAVVALAVAGVAAAQETAIPTAPSPAPPTPPVPPAPPAAKAARPNPPPADDAKQRIEINGRRDAVEQRRLSTAAKIIITREEIEQYGDLSLADVIKRLPSVTVAGRPGRGGQIRMRGMGNGYAQILIDGERMPPGFAIDQLAPDQIERIEILRAPTAETGARAIAGTINIILREPLRQRGDDLRLGVSSERGGLQPNASWTRNDVLGERGTYNLNLSVSHSDQHTDTQTDTTYTDLASGAVALQQHRVGRQHDLKSSAHLTSRLQWQLGGGDQFSLQPFAVLSQGHGQGSAVLTQASGAPPYDTSPSTSHSSSAIGRLMLQWRQRLGEATRMDLRGHVGTFRSDNDSQLTELSAGQAAPVLQQDVNTTIRDRSWSLSGKLSHTLMDKHSLVAGLEGEGVQRAENTLTRVNGTPTLADFDGDLTAATQRLAAYLQDEWDPSATWSAYAGLRWESIRTRSTSIAAPVSNTGTVLTPLAHAVWRFNAPARDQLRFSLTRSYRPPTLGNLTAIPRLSTLYPAPGANTAASPDRAGNPALRPELARGLGIALEHYLPAGGVLSFSAFSRHINDLIRNVTALETVSWATAPRWVSRPQNIGDANTQGVELDAKLRLDEIVANALPFTLRGNLGLYRSQVSGVPGPNNRIDQQPKMTLNLGGEYRLRSAPLTLGGNLSSVPGYAVQQTELQSLTVNTTRVLDAFALWALTPATKLRFSLSNALPRNYITGSTVLASGQSQTVVSNGPTYRVLTLRLETKL
jgi:iron complex outermembrane receptor protein